MLREQAEATQSSIVRIIGEQHIRVNLLLPCAWGKVRPDPVTLRPTSIRP
jgi:hypothetical protein